jgi:hypothetical protein
MYCSNCGKQLQDNCTICPNCGYAVQNPQTHCDNTASPNTERRQADLDITKYIAYGFIEIFFCSWLCGLLGIIFADYAKNAYSKQDMDGSAKYLKYARTSLIIGLVIKIVLILFFVMYFIFISTATFNEGFWRWTLV